MDEILYSEIQGSHETQDHQDNQSESKVLKTWLVFKVQDGTYAVESSNVREVLRNNEVFQMPFTPSYIKGVLNFYGKPYAVVDFMMIQNMQKTTTQLFLVLNDSADIALQIDDIVDFYTSEDVEEQQILDKSDTELFSQTITIGNVIAPVLDVQSISNKVNAEIEND
ncbi:chemotaxis protein CheW [Treponema sp.]|uniref:chemotaxis protein CheW n=1 Tax=Treponema sp. TaxID=166 RepID=UPI003890B4A3